MGYDLFYGAFSNKEMISNKRLYTYFIQFLFAMIKENDKMPIKDLVRVLDRVRRHAWGRQIDFDKERLRQSDRSLEYSFQKLLAGLESRGADREYEFFLQIATELSDLARGSKKKQEKLKDIVNQLRLAILIINAQETKRPSLFKFLLEARSFVEWPSMLFMHKLLPKRIDGKGKPVLLLPPLFGTDVSTAFLRKFLNEQGFKAYRWKLGVNLIRSYLIPPLENRLDQIYQETSEKVSLVGWSGGGMLAKILANRHPDKVEQLITLGSPIWGLDGLKTYITGLYELIRGKPVSERNESFNKEVNAIPKVPITCIYTKTDGVVPWKNCLESEHLSADIQNIEVYGSHSGLGANPAVLMMVAYALSQRIKGEKVEKLPPTFEKLLYPYFWKKKKEQMFKKQPKL